MSILVALIGVLVAAAASSHASDAKDDAIPEDVRAAAHASIEFEYGKISQSYADGASTMKKWMELEPSNTSGIAPTDVDDEAPVYVEFIRGHFAVRVPASDDHIEYKSGRIVFDEWGRILSVQFWGKEKPANTKLGPAFDDLTMTD